MADNYATNPGSGGITFASDDLGGVHVPRVKIMHGTDGQATDASQNSPLPVALVGPSAVEERVLKTLVDEATAGTVYICEAAIGAASSAAAWRVRRIVTAAGVTTTTWAGTGVFDQVADNRASLTYA